jgi:GNAT superfamily N-acetyltransferase
MIESSYPVAWVVRPVEQPDIENLVSLCEEHARYERVHYEPSGKAAALERAIFERPARLLVWVAEAHEHLIGYVAASNEFSTWSAREFLHMDCLFVRDEYRGNGVGAGLLATIVRFAREQGHAEVQWQTPHWNRDAKRFYLREGAIGEPKIRFVREIEVVSRRPAD